MGPFPAGSSFLGSTVWIGRKGRALRGHTEGKEEGRGRGGGCPSLSLSQEAPLGISPS